MIKTKLSGIFLATTLLAGIMLIGFSIGEAEAKKTREIVVVGSKVKDVVRSVKLQSCDVAYDAGGRTIQTVDANAGGVVKISDVPSEVTAVDVTCIFEGSSSNGPTIRGDLKPMGTTVIQYECISPLCGGF